MPCDAAGGMLEYMDFVKEGLSFVPGNLLNPEVGLETELFAINKNAESELGDSVGSVDSSSGR